MNGKIIPAIIGLVVIGGSGALVSWQKGERESQNLVQAMQQPAVQQGQYSLADVATHDNESDCWSIINGGVYNLTTWIPRHPGGRQAILGLCGKDGSPAFNGQHGGGAQQAAILATLKVGTLSQ